MPQIRLGQVDLATGELLEGATLAVFYPKRKNGFVEGWVAMAQNAMQQLAKANLGSEAMRVLLMLLGRLDFENQLVVSQAELGRTLEMKASSVSRAVARLVQEGALLAGPRVGINRTYTLNPQYGWKGSAKGHQDALAARMKARGMSVIAGGAGAPGGQVVDVVDDRTADLFDQV
jgi:basic membrane lipoprotein Med (substrate-binding protein (PBP1-ABC) superfamily)